LYNSLIAFISIDWGFWFTVLQVCIALGLVIFVHELGHFLAAKACGVKVHKFYVGFDFFGWKLFKFKWGETEYGIGAFPLGGYVKMLGQEDNPAQLRAEIERAKLQESQSEASSEDAEKETSETDAKAETAKPVEAAKEKTEEEVLDGRMAAIAEQSLYDPRSYLQKSVPQRMLIISAGVIMNLIFAFIFAVIAFPMGVPRLSAGVGGLEPGSPAWQADMQIGDKVKKIGENDVERFIEMRIHTTLGGEDDVTIELAREGQSEPVVKTIITDKSGLAPRLGITSPSIPVIAFDWDIPEPLLQTTPTAPPTEGDEKVADAEEKPALLQDGDTILRINETKINTHAELVHYLATHRDEPLDILVERPVPKSKTGEVDNLSVTVPVIPMLRLGIIMKLGPVAAIQQGSPADAVEEGVEKIRPGDRIISLNVVETGETIEIGDPMTLDRRIGELSGKTVTVEVERDGKKLLCPLFPREVDHYHRALHPDNPIVLCSLGIACRFENEVIETITGSAGDEAGIKPGAKIVSAVILAPKPDGANKKVIQKDKRIDFEKNPAAYASLIDIIQRGLPGTTVKIKWDQDGIPIEKVLTPRYDESINLADRGFVLMPDMFIQQAKSFGEAIRLGWNETISDTLLVYRFLQLLVSGEISGRAMGGPVEIFKQARSHAESGMAQLLLFLTMLSANLAVINFLPIPLFDGGQMVLLLYEWVRGKPASERVQEVLAYIGLFFILSLMFWVLALDLGFISRT